MRIELSPVVVLPEDSTDMDVMVSGDSIAVSGVMYDFSQLPEGDICQPLPSMRAFFREGYQGRRRDMPDIGVSHPGELQRSCQIPCPHPYR